MRILLGGDFHLGARQGYLGDKAEARRDDLNRAFSRFTDFALRPENEIDLVLLLGDVFDHHAPASGFVAHVTAEIDRMLRGELSVAGIPGNHDGYGYPDSVYRSADFPAGLHLITSPELSRTTIEVSGAAVHLYGMAYDPGRTPPNPLDGMGRDPDAGEGFHIAMIHGSIPASPEWEYRRRDLPVPTADLAASRFDLLAMGHYHNFMQKEFGSTTVVYPGTLEGLKYSEPGERAFVVVELSGKGVTVDRSPYPGRRIQEENLNLDIDGRSRDELEAKILAFAGEDRIVRFHLAGEAPIGFEAESLQARLRDRFFHLEIDDHTVRVDELWADRVASERTVRGLFVRKMRERIAGAPETDRPLLEAALRMGLSEFGEAEATHVD